MTDQSDNLPLSVRERGPGGEAIQRTAVCRHCNGCGYIILHYCTFCGGDPDEGYPDPFCPECFGGDDHTAHDHTCPSCNGEGFIILPKGTTHE